MSLDFDNCLKRGKIRPFSRGRTIAPKELETAKEDMARAEKTFNEGDYKWATVQLYYSMFHSARALLYFENLREHSHHCLIIAMREMYVNAGKLPAALIEGLQEAKNLREDADYYSRWSQAACEKLLRIAKEFIVKCSQIIQPSSPAGK